jgi:hypothetical protein
LGRVLAAPNREVAPASQHANTAKRGNLMRQS